MELRLCYTANSASVVFVDIARRINASAAEIKAIGISITILRRRPIAAATTLTTQPSAHTSTVLTKPSGAKISRTRSVICSVYGGGESSVFREDSLVRLVMPL